MFVAQECLTKELHFTDVQLDLLDLTHGLFTEDAIEVAIVVGDLTQGSDITCIDQLAYATGIVHRFVLQC